MALPRFESAPVQEAVRTQLAPVVAVTAATTADPSRFKNPRAPAVTDQATANQGVSTATGIAGATEHQTSFDAETGAVILRVVDLSNGMVVRQQPAEAILKLRAYQRATAAESSQETATKDRLA